MRLRVKVDVAETGALALINGWIGSAQVDGRHIAVVMDDVLVNFDPDRAPQVARSIEEISSTRQVIYLTCHNGVVIRPNRTIEVGGDVEVRSTRDTTPTSDTAPLP